MLLPLVTKLSLRFLALTVLGAFFTNIALAQSQESVSDQVASQVADVGASAMSLMNQLKGHNLEPKFIADGQAIELENIGLRITPPAGWEVITSDPKLSLIFQEPESEKIVYDKPTYQRNITVAKVAEPAPIDEARAEQLKAELMDTFGKRSIAKDFTILEHQFFNYRGEKDGLLVYSSFDMTGYQMTQLHVLLSGNERQFLLTYTDMSERFQDTEMFASAWNSMVSAEVSGLAPSRYLNTLIGTGILASMMLILLMIARRRRRRATSMYLDEADLVYQDDWNDEPSQDTGLTQTQTGIWNLGGNVDGPVETRQQHTDTPISFATNF